MKAVLAVMASLAVLAAPGAFGAVRVAVMDFAVDDNSYRSAQAASSFTSLLQTELSTEPDIDWVERAQLELARKEFALREIGQLSGSSSIRPGQWLKADWLVTGKFSLDDQSLRTLLVEITDLAHADVLASETITFPGEAIVPMKLEQKHLQLALPVLQRLFRQARQRADEAEHQAIVVPLFFTDLRRSGFKDEFEPLRNAFYDGLEQFEPTNSRLRIIRFPKAYLAMDESEMVLQGLVDSAMSSWENIADIYLWGTYSNFGFFTHSRTNAHVQQTEMRHQLSFHVWDGLSAPFTYETEFRHSNYNRLTVEESKAFWHHLQKEITQHAVKRNPGEGQPKVRREIANSMVKLFRSANPGPPLPADHSRFLENVRLLETACFLDPDNAEAQILRMYWRWGTWMSFQPATKNPFWSKWRRSNAWGKYVEKFGFAAPGAQWPQLSFSYDRREIPRVYVDSLADVLQIFPTKVETDEQMKAEWSQTRQAQRYGFPKDIPSERIAEWRSQLQTELAERKRKAEAYLKLLAETNAFATSVAAPVKAPSSPSTNAGARPATNIPPRLVASSASKTNAHPARQTLPRGTPQQALMKSAPQQPPTWMPQLGQERSLFQLRAPGLWPMEITNVINDIIFPAHFDTKTVLKIVPWRDQLVLLVVDERSAPTSDPNAEISEELLTQAGRLWLVQEGSNPRLLRARGMPQTVRAFLIQNDRLWLAVGEDFGYLDLTDLSFHACHKGEAPELWQDEVIALSGGRLYTLEHLSLASFDPVSSKWQELPRPNRRPLQGVSRQTLLAANEHWLCYASGSPDFYNIAGGFWTNVSGILMAHCADPVDSGFWIGGRTGLHFYDPDRRFLETWRPPAIFSGSHISSRPLDLETLSQDPGDVATIPNGPSDMPEIFRKPISSTNGFIAFRPPQRDPLRLESHIPGTVTALLGDGDSLWLAIADRLLLLDLPSRSLVACCRFGGPIISIGIQNKDVWVGLAYGKQLLAHVPKQAFYSVPKSAWTPLIISAEERKELLGNMSLRDEAVYAFYAGDLKRLARLLEKLTPGGEGTNLELMLLAAFAYGPSGIDDPTFARAWCEQLITHYPDSPWAKFAQKELDENEQNHKLRQHQDWLFAKFDLNKDGILDDAEKGAMEKSAEFQREERRSRQELLLPQLQVLVKRYDRDGDGKLSTRELVLLKARVALFLDTSSERLERERAYVAPLLTKEFPSVEKLLKKYDSNGDGALDAAELKAFAQDIKR